MFFSYSLRSKIFIVFITAVFVLIQAVFLMSYMIGAQAEEPDLTSVVVGFSGNTPSPASATVPVNITVNQKVDKVLLSIESQNGKIEVFPMSSTDQTLYTYDWDTTLFNNGTYSLSGQAIIGALSVRTMAPSKLLVEVENVAPLEEVVEVVTKPELLILSPIYYSTLTGKSPIRIKTNFKKEDLDIIIDPGHYRFKAPLNRVLGDEYEYEYIWDTIAHGNGPYTIMVATHHQDIELEENVEVDIFNTDKDEEASGQTSIGEEFFREEDPFFNATNSPVAVDSTPASTTKPAFTAQFEDDMQIIKVPDSLYVKTSEEVDLVNFIIIEKGQMLQGKKLGELRWELMESDLKALPKGEYTIKALVRKGDSSINFERRLEIDFLTPEQNVDPSYTSKAPKVLEETIVDKSVSVEIVEPGTAVDKGLVRIEVFTKGEVVDVVVRSVYSEESIIVLGKARSYEDGRWEYFWDANNFLNNKHKIDAVAISESGQKFFSQPIDIILNDRALEKEPNDMVGLSGKDPVESVFGPSSVNDSGDYTESGGKPDLAGSAGLERIVLGKIQRKAITKEKKNLENFIDPPLVCLEKGIYDNAGCEFFLKNMGLPAMCAEPGISDYGKCRSYAYGIISKSICEKSNIIGDSECRRFLVGRYKGLLECAAEQGDNCSQAYVDDYLEDIVIKQASFEELKEKTAGIVGSSVRGAILSDRLKHVKGLLPLASMISNMMILPARGKIIINEKGYLEQSPSAFLCFDSDGDGLEDEVEKRLGTDPFNSDSDGDGYGDREEVLQGYNPAGEGVFLKSVFAPVESALLNGVSFGHPKTEGRENKDLSVDEITNIDLRQENEGKSIPAYVFSGKAEPGSVLALYIYSDLPLVATVMADEYGHWQYELSGTLSDGEHQVYLAENDNAGRVVSKSLPFIFLVKDARAVSAYDQKEPLLNEKSNETESMFMVYVLIALALVLSFAVLLAIIYVINARKRSLNS